ncbi:MAG: phosphatase PAP2 family protein [Gemmatimonadota bacterium]
MTRRPGPGPAVGFLTRPQAAPLEDAIAICLPHPAAARRLALLVLLLASAAHAGGALQVPRRLADRDNLAILALGGGLAAAAHPWDDDLKGQLEGVWLPEITSGFTNLYGASSVNLPASAILWAGGHWAGRPALAAAGRDLTVTLAMAQVLVGPLKLSVRRRRPDGSNRRSFPSGHAANAFAVARLAHRRLGPRAGVPLYVVGVLTAAGRIEDDKHYLSDVVMGSALGIVAANCAVGDGGRDWSLRPCGRGGVAAVWRF